MLQKLKFSYSFYRSINQSCTRGYDSYQNSSHQPRLSTAQDDLAMQNGGLKHDSFHLYTIHFIFISFLIYHSFHFVISFISFCNIIHFILCHSFHCFFSHSFSRPIVQLIKGRNVTVQVKAAAALEALADHNAASQKAFLELDAPKALMRLLKVQCVFSEIT